MNNVNAYHGRLKEWMRRFHGVATKNLPNYLDGTSTRGVGRRGHSKNWILGAMGWRLSTDNIIRAENTFLGRPRAHNNLITLNCGFKNGTKWKGFGRALLGALAQKSAFAAPCGKFGRASAKDDGFDFSAFM